MSLFPLEYWRLKYEADKTWSSDPYAAERLRLFLEVSLFDGDPDRLIQPRDSGFTAFDWQGFYEGSEMFLWELEPDEPDPVIIPKKPEDYYRGPSAQFYRT